MLLAIDIGNTNISIGVFKEDSLIAKKSLKTNLKASQVEVRDEISDFLKNDFPNYINLNRAIIGSVVPSITNLVKSSVEQIIDLNVCVVNSKTKTNIDILYDTPSEVGSDRICDAVAAKILYPKNKIIVDFGTATVFDAVTEQGEYLGGAISPGIHISSESLYLHTSLLKRIEVSPTKKVIGTNTNDSLQSGLFWGYLDLVEGMIKRFKEELYEYTKNDQIFVIATGGLATLMSSYTEYFDKVDQELTLKGLNFIYQLNFR